MPSLKLKSKKKETSSSSESKESSSSSNQSSENTVPPPPLATVPDSPEQNESNESSDKSAQEYRLPTVEALKKEQQKQGEKLIKKFVEDKKGNKHEPMEEDSTFQDCSTANTRQESQ